MARIGFYMSRQEGHLLPSFKLARALQVRGHSVFYLCVADMHEYIASRGLEFVPVLGDVYRSGTRARLAQMRLEQQAAQTEELTRHIFEAIARGALEPTLDQERPDLLVVDANRPIVALSAYHLGIKAVSLSTCMPMARAPGIPPATTTIVPAPGWYQHLRISSAWLRVKLGRLLWERNRLIPFTYRMTKRAAVRCGYPLHSLDMDSHIAPRLATLTELVLCPKEFDFPRPESAKRHFIEACVDGERSGAENFPWHQLTGSNRVIYCAFGSQTFRYATLKPLFQALIDAMERRPTQRLVLAFGSRTRALDLRVRSNNALLVDWAPQLEVLKRTSVMITHGGLGSVKECILAGVPMIVFPQCYDQYGNAARVVYHGIGVLADERRISAGYIDSLLAALESDPGYHLRVGAMREAFMRAEGSGRGVAIIERLLARTQS